MIVGERFLTLGHKLFGLFMVHVIHPFGRNE
jgi:hypothetical protein